MSTTNLLYTYWQESLPQADLTLQQFFFKELVQAYESEKRYYHNLAHIKHLFDLLAPLAAHMHDKQAIYLAIFYHDIVYNSLRQDNEWQSALLAQKQLAQMQVPTTVIQRVTTLIVATKTHIAPKNDQDCAYFLDADLAILGASSHIYTQYSQQIREEYAWIPTFVYRRGRKRVLTQLLQKKPLYYTSHFRQQFEMQALKNLHAAIALL